MITAADLARGIVFVDYFFNTPEQQREMLAAIGLNSIDELFDQIPQSLQLQREPKLPPAAGELELDAEIRSLSASDLGASSAVCFAGGGAYDHFVPAAVDELASRGEFYTAYTPYQAEASQGSLQVFFEFQSLVCRLTDMEVSNASLYEGATAASEAAFMAMRITGRYDRIVILESAHPQYREVLATYLRNLDCELVTVPAPDGIANPAQVADALNDKTACLIAQHPNFFGCLEDARALGEAARRQGALFVVSFDPSSLGLLERPGQYGADIAVAEGQALGIPLQYGGPYLGILACRQKYVRKMPGRLIGQTTDRKGQSCYVLNLQAREQHIRRDKATSNICTNQGLLALRATIYMSLMGPHGMRQVAELCTRKAHYAAEQLCSIDGISLAYDQPFFKEFVVRCEQGTDAIQSKAAAAGFDIGPSMKTAGMDSATDLLVAVTEQRTRHEIDQLANAIAQ